MKSILVNYPDSCSATVDSSGNINIVEGAAPPVVTPPPVVDPPPVVGGPCTINLTFPWVYTANKVVGMGAEDSISIKFVPQLGKSPYSNISGGEWSSPPANRTYTLSKTPCDFGQGVGVGKFPRTSSSVSVDFSVGKPNTFGGPVLMPGETYYLNIKNTAPVQPGSHQMFFNVKP